MSFRLLMLLVVLASATGCSGSFACEYQLPMGWACNDDFSASCAEIGGTFYEGHSCAEYGYTIHPWVGDPMACVDTSCASRGSSPGAATGGSCTAKDTGICNELVSGSASAFKAQCGALWVSTPCATTSSKCTAMNGASSGSAVVVNAYWPSDFCARFPNADNRSTCVDLGGTFSGTACTAP